MTGCQQRAPTTRCSRPRSLGSTAPGPYDEAPPPPRSAPPLFSPSLWPGVAPRAVSAEPRGRAGASHPALCPAPRGRGELSGPGPAQPSAPRPGTAGPPMHFMRSGWGHGAISGSHLPRTRAGAPCPRLPRARSGGCGRGGAGGCCHGPSQAPRSGLCPLPWRQGPGAAKKRIYL